MSEESQDMGSLDLLFAVDRLATSVHRFERQFEQTERQETQKRDWQRVAFVCDRFLLYVFVVVTAIASCLILFSSPHGPLQRAGHRPLTAASALENSSSSADPDE